MNFRDYRLWAAVCFALFLAVAALLLFGRTPESDIPIGVGTEAQPAPSQYLEFQAKESRFRELAEKEPENPDPLAALGDLYFENNNFAEASAQYEKALALDPNDVDTYNDLGLAYHYTGKSALAVETLRKGTKVDPSYQRIWLSLGFVLASSGRLEEAQKALEEAISLNPSSDVGVEAKRILDSMKSR